MKKITILIALFIGVMIGCQNSDLESAPTENLRSNDQLLPLRETFDFTYNGKTYSSPFYMENDTLMILEDEEVAAIHNRLQEFPDLATYITPNGDIEYYDTYNELLEKLPKQTQRNSLVNPIKYTLTVYEHANYNRDRTGKIQNFEIPVLLPELKSYGMNDMISSCAVTNSLNPGTIGSVTFFRDPNYQAQSITFTYAYPLGDPTWNNYVFLLVENFHNYKIKKKINWNDRISSLKAF